MKTFSLLLALTCWLPGLLLPTAIQAQSRPNIVWLIVEDMSPHFGCYGESTIQTPHVDRLAAGGIRFSNAFVTAPVCSTARSALITGMYQTSIGAHHHRSGRGASKIRLPAEVRPVPGLFQQAGYFTCNGGVGQRRGRPGKTDYNFTWDTQLYGGSEWSQREPGQPFFAQIQLSGGKLRHGNAWHDTVQRDLGQPVDPRAIQLPPYYPDDPVIRQDWADYLDAVRYTDREVGGIMARLRAEGLLENTYVFLMTDHGISHIRGKQFLYDEGIHIPLIVTGPGLQSGVTREDLVEHIDLAATSLALAGIEIPRSMHGRDVLAKSPRRREYVVAARDRCDETVDHMRCVRTSQYKYIRNFLPERPYLQPNAYKDNKLILQALRRCFAEGRLNEPQSLIMMPTRPPEELYDLQQDPHELHNLAASSDQAPTLAALRAILSRWMDETGDQGRHPEPAAMYDSDMKVYVDKIAIRRPERAQEIRRNIAWMKQQASAGK